MAYIENPQNFDTDDDAVFSSLLSQGLVWIEDDEDEGNDFATEVTDEAYNFVAGDREEWVNFSRLNHHLYATFGKIDAKKLGDTDKKYKTLIAFFADNVSEFELRLDDKKSGLYWIRVVPTPPPPPDY